MGKIDFNRGWKCFPKGNENEIFDVELPHDAMLLDPRRERAASGVNAGWYESRDYVYRKVFCVPEEWLSGKVLLEFEGAYRKATVWVNGEKAAYHEYGYTGFYTDITGFLRGGEENVVEVETLNSDQPNCRWYSGTGLYRPVWMYLLPKRYIRPDGIRITTLDYKEPKIHIEAEVTGEILEECRPSSDPREDMATIEILDGEKVIARAETVLCDAGDRQHAFAEVHSQRLEENISRGEDQNRPILSAEFHLPDAVLWEPDHPKLYTCRVTLGEDTQETPFGIRMIECTPEKGFCLNGERVILRGACIHHDNGILGACAYDYAERRKVRLLKENGYNALRSAHNPCSKALLRACDELGMLVMDEYADMWYIHKTKYDYASFIEAQYRDDLKAIVDKDYNHPSVVMYSTGNEVSETAQQRGIRLCGELTGRLHELDATRPVTCGVNIFFNFLSSMGFGVYSDKKAEKEEGKNKKKKKAVGSEFFNKIAGIFGANFMKAGAALYPCDVKTRDAFAKMDVAGYNYGIRRYRHDMEKYPGRLIVGSETFCSDAYRFWETAKKHPRLIGDFVWSGMDYLGEVGIGAWEYAEYAPRFDKELGWISAGAGRLDLTGKPLAEMAYTRVAFELAPIGIGVIPVNNTDSRHSPSAWKMTNALESWSWNGCGGKKARVEVYARADLVKLYINGICVGAKKPVRDCRVVFDTTYHDGEVRAAAFDIKGNMIAETSLKTAGPETVLTLEPEEKSVDAAAGLCYIRLKYTDKNGTVKPLARGEIRVSVKGGTLLGTGSACPYYPGSYLDGVTDTYYGEAIAIVRPDGSGAVLVTAESPYGSASTEILAV